MQDIARWWGVNFSTTDPTMFSHLKASIYESPIFPIWLVVVHAIPVLFAINDLAFSPTQHTIHANCYGSLLVAYRNRINLITS